MSHRLHVALLLCASALPPEELQVLQQLLPLAPEPCDTEAVRCEEGHVTQLTLEGQQLQELPKNVGELHRLKRLFMKNNQLQRLPDSLGNLRSLEWLELRDTKLLHLPDTLGNLESLEHLYLNNNQLQGLPNNFGNLTSLRELELKNNQLHCVPYSFGNLELLKGLDLTNNQLQGLPGSFGNLRSLRRLWLNDNQLHHLPDSFGNLKNLDELWLNNNQLQRLPDSFGNLENIGWVDLTNNKVQRLPDGFGSLKRLGRLSLKNNQLQSLPETFGNLKRLEELDFKNNRLQRLPDNLGNLKFLKRLDLKKNQLQRLPSNFGQLKRLEHLALQENQLEDFLPGKESSLESLKVLLLQHNALQCSIEHFCQWPALTTLYLHKNQINGQLHCLSSMHHLQVLTLHQNKLSGPIPRSLANLFELKLLTVHGNQLSGPIPHEISSLKSLAFLSAHDNAFTGSIPELNLARDCADDQSMTVTVVTVTLLGHAVEVACGDLAGLNDTFTIFGHRQDWDQFLHEHPLLELSCPATLGKCSNASARGPTLLLHGNRLSCAVPPQVTEVPSALRSLVLMGNALGNESKALPSWVAETEQQPFLYVSSPTAQYLCILFIGLALLCTMAWRGIIGSWTHLRITEAPEDPTERSYVFVIKAAWLFAPLAFVLLCLYESGSSYYTCGDRFLTSTVAYFGVDGREACVVCLGWLLWMLGSSVQLRMVPKGQHHRKGASRNKVPKPLWWTMWFGLVLCLSAPSMAYAVASTLPQQNSVFTGTWLLWAIKSQSALVMLLVDMLVTPKLAASIAQHSGIRRSMLLMAARSATMWFNATMFTLYLSEHCYRGWTRLWTVCDPSSDDYKSFNISLGEHQLLEPLEDLCQQNKDWLATDACMRSVVGTLAPLFLSKMIQRAFLQPVITLVLWKLSVAEAGKLFFTPLAFLGRGPAATNRPTLGSASGLRRWRICTSRSLDRAQQATFLVTLMEVVLIWGAFIPLLIPVAALAAMTNLRVFRVGTRVFGAAVPELEEGKTGSMSRKYLKASLAVLLIFQNWFAWAAQMDGRSLPLLATLAFLGTLVAPARRNETAETAEAQEHSMELTTMG